jgi:hypothetical protein
VPRWRTRLLGHAHWGTLQGPGYICWEDEWPSHKFPCPRTRPHTMTDKNTMYAKQHERSLAKCQLQWEKKMSWHRGYTSTMALPTVGHPASLRRSPQAPARLPPKKCPTPALKQRRWQCSGWGLTGTELRLARLCKERHYCSVLRHQLARLPLMTKNLCRCDTSCAESEQRKSCNGPWEDPLEAEVTSNTQKGLLQREPTFPS